MVRDVLRHLSMERLTESIFVGYPMVLQRQHLTAFVHPCTVSTASAPELCLLFITYYCEQSSLSLGTDDHRTGKDLMVAA